jgi:MarR family transcriptional regulator, lower aerobic nicotinate degradation pathway regulator
MTIAARARAPAAEALYILDDQVGFVLRQAQQRHTNIFASLMIEELTPTQWAVVAKLYECGPCSQNLLGRQTAMDAATIKGVIDRLTKRGVTATTAVPADARRLLVTLTAEGMAIYERAKPMAKRITKATLEPLSAVERELFIALLRRLA